MIGLEILGKNLASVRERIAAAARRSGRLPESVTLVAVTKTVGVAEIRMIRELGVPDVGENRVREAVAKMEALRGCGMRWHMIGHLQTNKVRKVIGAFDLIHSVGNIRLAHALSVAGGEAGVTVKALLQINVSGESTKGGFHPESLDEALEIIAAMPNLRIGGLMTMAPIVDDPEKTRPIFSRLRTLRDACAATAPPGIELKHLSMGMTQDFEVAVEEGADIVRIGAALFLED